MRNKKLWINERDYIQFADDRNTTIVDELATRKRSIDFYGLGMYLPNPDPVLKKMGKDIDVYEELLVDGHLGGCVTSRKSGVKSLEWEIHQGESKTRQAKNIQKIFNDLDIDRIIGEMLNAPLFGYQPLEVIWGNINGYIVPIDIIAKPQRWFVFTADNELRLRTKDNYIEGEKLPGRKFLLAQHEATYDNPYGFPELSRCFWPATFKKGGFKFWVIFAEKYGMPFMIGKHPRGVDQRETDALANMLEAMVQDAIAVIPDDSSVELLTTSWRTSSDIYADLIEACKTEISIAILGQNLSTEVKTGSYAAALSHMKVRGDIIDSDKKIIQKEFNKLIKWIYDLNYSESISEYPTFIMYEIEDVDKTLAERDAILTRAGVKFTKQYFQREYGFQDGDIDVDTNATIVAENATTELAENSKVLFPDQKAIDDAIDSISPEELQKQMEGILKPVIDLIQEGKSYEDILSQLAETFPEMNDEALTDMLSRAIFVSELWGRLNA